METEDVIATMLTEVASAVLGATAAGIVTHMLTRVDKSMEETRLEGQGLIELPDYPIRVKSDGTLVIDTASFRRVAAQLLQTYNPRAAIDLLYLAEHNRAELGEAELEMLERVRRRYRRRFKRLVEPKALAGQREHLLKQFYNITDGLGDTFSGVPIEFALHDTRDLIHSICVIKNSITGRREGDEATSFGEDVILAYGQMRWTGTKHSYRLRHPKDGREIKATTIPLEDRKLGLIAFLCVNIDIARLAPDSPELRDLAGKLIATPGGWGAQVFEVEEFRSWRRRLRQHRHDYEGSELRRPSLTRRTRER
jgi:predicted transcriptional regulator YheO